MSATHTVIESLAAYEAVRAADPSGPRIWWTTSPYLLMSLPARGEDVRSPEEGLPQEQFDALALAARDLGDEFCAWYQDACDWKSYVRFQFVLALQLTRCMFVTCYKALLLSRVVASAAGAPVVCVGRPGEPEPAAFSLIYGRVDTLFSALATEWGPQGPEVHPFQPSPEAARAIELQVRHRPMGRAEKILSLLNNTPSAWVFKTWKNLSRRGLYRSSLSLLPLRRKTYWIHKECELLQEAALGILRRGGRIAQLPKLPQPGGRNAEAAGPHDASDVAERIGTIAQAAVGRHGAEWLPAYGVAMALVTRRCLGFLGRLQRELASITTGFDKATEAIRTGDEILSSALTTPLEGLFYSYCRSKGIAVSAFDHGVTLGLSAWSDSEARQAGMLAADRGFYHCPRAVESIRRHAPWQETHVVGLPRCTARPVLRRLQRSLGRQLLGLGRDEHVLMHVPDLERNNFIYGPWQENDLQFLRKTRQVTQALCRAYPRSRVVLKLYPTQRYMDAYDFSDLTAEHPNLLVVGDIDFRFVRACSDLNFTASTQSTLGWVEGAGAPMAFLEFRWAPARVTGLRLEWPGVEDLSAMLLPDRGAACLAPPGDVARAIMGEC
jgi:hypothetical protein